MQDYIFLGIVQGIFEWLPVSSEGMVALTSQFLTKDINSIDIALFLHLGTLFAVLVYFKDDWKNILAKKNRILFRFLAISTIVSLAIGFPIYQLIRDVATGTILLLIMGLGLLFTAYLHKSKKSFGLDFNKNLTKLAVISGLLQGFAVIPGLSRSGATIFGLSLGKLQPTEILKISYMMSAPVVIASSSYLFLKNPILLTHGWSALVSGFFTGLVALGFLMKTAEKINFYVFCLIFAMLCFAGAIIGFLII